MHNPDDVGAAALVRHMREVAERLLWPTCIDCGEKYLRLDDNGRCGDCGRIEKEAGRLRRIRRAVRRRFGPQLERVRRRFNWYSDD